MTNLKVSSWLLTIFPTNFWKNSCFGFFLGSQTERKHWKLLNTLMASKNSFFSFKRNKNNFLRSHALQSSSILRKLQKTFHSNSYLRSYTFKRSTILRKHFPFLRQIAPINFFIFFKNVTNYSTIGLISSKMMNESGLISTKSGLISKKWTHFSISAHV